MQLPIACTLGPAAFRAQRADTIAGLLERAASRETLPDGLRIRFEARSETLADVARTIELERQCCRFLTFQVTVLAADAGIVVDVTGPPGTGEFLASMIAEG